LLVAIDGPAGAGKSTVARAVARELGFTYLDSGAMYRCVGLLALRSPAADPAQLAAGARLELVPGRGGAARVLLDGCDVSEEIRAPEVSQAASHVAADPGVRHEVVARQRRLLAQGDWVAEGRDIGTVVAPQAALKVFLTAEARERARRRAAQLGADLAAVEREQAERDERDLTRAHSPLVPAPDAVALDTTELSFEQVVDRVAELARQRRGA
jgi:cytidylate kinase